MKTIITILICFMAISTYSQEIEVGYFPKQKKGISDEKYNRGKKTLEYVYTLLEKDSTIYATTYWNLATGFNMLKEKPEKIYKFLALAKKENSNRFCVVVHKYLRGRDIKTCGFYKTLGKKFLDLVTDCKKNDLKPKSLEDMIAEKESMDLSGLNETLIDRLIILMEKDTRYRGRSFEYGDKNKEAWIKLDTEARIELLELFEENGYAGKDIVGEKYQNYMCQFLEHVGGIEAQEKYLPLVANAFKNNQLHAIPLKMLIDRIYSTKTKTQIFGSHAGVPYAKDSIIAQVKKDYSLLDKNLETKIKVGSKSIIIKNNNKKQ